MIRLPLFLMGYVFGCLQTSFFYGKKQGLDIREHGSGNAGTTNAFRVMGKKAALIVFLGDMGKMVLALLIALLLAHFWGPEYRLLALLYTAFGVVIGHDFPYYMHFKGGKGIASTGGLMLILDWRIALYSFVSFVGLLLTSKIVSVASLTMVAGDLILYLILLLNGTIDPGVMPLWEAILIFAVIIALDIWSHRANIGRLIRGEEKRLEL